jgi:hypothetical protein
MSDTISTHFFQCDRCHLECRVDSEASEQGTTLRLNRDGEGMTVLGTVTRFQERRGGLWVDVQRWIDVA